MSHTRTPEQGRSLARRLAADLKSSDSARRQDAAERIARVRFPGETQQTPSEILADPSRIKHKHLLNTIAYEWGFLHWPDFMARRLAVVPPTRVRVRLSDIVWDTESDGEVVSVDLPDEMEIDLDLEPDDTDDSLWERALDAASDRTGWLISASHFERSPAAPEPSRPSERQPTWVTYVLRTDEAAGTEIIVEPWEGAPPFGWMAGERFADQCVAYFGHARESAADVIAGFNLEGSIRVEITWSERDAQGQWQERTEKRECSPSDLPYDWEVGNEEEWEDEQDLLARPRRL